MASSTQIRRYLDALEAAEGDVVTIADKVSSSADVSALRAAWSDFVHRHTTGPWPSNAPGSWEGGVLKAERAITLGRELIDSVAGER